MEVAYGDSLGRVFDGLKNWHLFAHRRCASANYPAPTTSKVVLYRDTGSVDPGSRPYFGSVSGSENHFSWFLVLYLHLRDPHNQTEPIHKVVEHNLDHLPNKHIINIISSSILS